MLSIIYDIKRTQKEKKRKQGERKKSREGWVKIGDPGCPRNLYSFYSDSSLHAAWDPL